MRKDRIPAPCGNSELKTYYARSISSGKITPLDLTNTKQNRTYFMHFQNYEFLSMYANICIQYTYNMYTICIQYVYKYMYTNSIVFIVLESDVAIVPYFTSPIDLLVEPVSPSLFSLA